VARIIPRGEDVKWVIGYHFFESETLSRATRSVSLVGAAAAGWKHRRVIEKRRRYVVHSAGNKLRVASLEWREGKQRAFVRFFILFYFIFLTCPHIKLGKKNLN
jgi:hypothetical protein